MVHTPQRGLGRRGFCRKKIVAIDQFHLCGTGAIVPNIVDLSHYRSPAEKRRITDFMWRRQLGVV
jgi:hypothetical protein